MKKILAIDGNSIINRAFYGVHSSLTTRTGKPTNAVFGMLNIISKQLDMIKPDYAIAAFDLKTPNFRKKIYDAYKAGRHETPPDLLAQFDDAKECLELMGIHVLTLEGYEADDILGTVADFALKNDGVEAFVLSGDRDMLQLINKKVSVLLATNSETVRMRREEFFEKYGIEPAQFVDLKALMGDSSDNIPGVGGVGEKTALKLMKEFGSLDRIYENLDAKSISAGLREKLERDKEMAYLSQTLARIIVNAPLDKELSDIEYRGFNRPALKRKLLELEFNAMIRKFSLEDVEAEPNKTKEEKPTVPPYPTYISATAEEILTSLKKTYSIDFKNGIYLYDGENAFFYDGDILEIAPIFTGAYDITCFDSKALYHFLSKNEVHLTAIPKDIMLSAYVLDSTKGTPKKDALIFDFYGIMPSEESDVHLYAGIDEEIRKKLSEQGSLSLLDEVELPLATILAETEENGFKVDTEGLKKFGDHLEAEATKIANEIYKLAGIDFNINSPKQLGEVLFLHLGLSSGRKNSKGFSTDVDVLNSLKDKHPIINLILEYRQLAKLNSTYAQGLVKAADKNGRIHTDFKQALTATGRLSSAEPNLQNIPIKTELGREMRKFFTADEGYVLVDADYSQIELRILSAIANDTAMITAFRDGADIHSRTAAAVFNIPEAFVTEELRKKAKAVNFGIVYGIGAYSLSGDLNISVAEAKKYIQSYLDNYPQIEEYLKKVVEDAKNLGYTQTLFGRRRYIPELSSSNANIRNFGKRAAMNSPIQGTAADVIKIAMIKVFNRLKKEIPDARLIMQVHDELIVECPEAKKESAAKILKEEMERAVKLSVPLTVDVDISTTWYS